MSGNLEGSQNVFKIDFTVSAGPQPHQFKLRISKNDKKFKDSFKFKLGNTGLYYGDDYFIANEDTVYEPQALTKSNSKLYEILFYIFLVWFFYSVFFYH